MPDALSYALALVNLAGAAGFAYITYRLYRAASALQGRMDAPLAFAMLLAAQLAGALAHLAPEREAFAAYTATGSLTAAALASLMAAGSRGYPIVALQVPPALLAFATDAMAVLVAAAGVFRFRGEARLLSAILALAFALRALSIPLLPSPPGLWALAIGEALRALAAAALALRYAAPAVVGIEEEKEQG